jgi:serine phosphatase RsbU (regulator of sigma subunit)
MTGREAAAAASAAAVVGTGVALGPGTGIGATVLGAGVLALGAAMVLPVVIEGQRRRAAARAVRDLLRRGLRARRPEQLGLVIAEAHAEGFVGGASLVVPGPSGETTAVSASGEAPVDISDPAVEAGLSALAAGAGPLVRGAAEHEALMRAIDAEVAVPLVHRGMLIGVLGFDDRRIAREPEYLDAARVIATVCLANTFLDREARSRGRLRELFGLAGEMQRSLLPAEGEHAVELGGPAISRATIAGRTSPMSECGGDVWSWRRTGGGELALLIGDATGHGAAPALLAALIKGAFDATVARAGLGLDPAEVLAELDRHVTAAGRGSYQMTALVIAIDGSGAARVASAGHCFPLLIRGAEIAPIAARGDVLGLAGGRWEVATATLSPGEKLVGYTDGVVEAGAPVVAAFGERRLRAAVAGAASSGPGAICAGLFAEVDRFLGGQEPADDVTAVAVEVGR